MLKENLKLIKDRLKLWHQNHTQNLEDKIKAVKDHMSFLDAKGDEQDLTKEKLRDINSLSSEILLYPNYILPYSGKNLDYIC